MLRFKLIHRQKIKVTNNRKKKGFSDCNHDTVIMGKGIIDNSY